MADEKNNKKFSPDQETEKNDSVEKTMSEKTSTDTGNRSGKILKWTLLGLGAACVILVIFLLVLDSSGAKYRLEHSAEYGYTIKYDETRYTKERVRLDGETYMERVGANGSAYSNFLGVSPISDEVDLNEVLEAFQSDGSYSFQTGEATIGKGGYKATRISYTDTEGEISVTVSYYYMLDRKTLVTVSCDPNHKKELAKMLASLEFDN